MAGGGILDPARFSTLRRVLSVGKIALAGPADPATVILVAPLFDAAVSLAERRAATWAGRLGSYLRPFEFLFWPLAAPLAALSRWVVKRFAPPPDEHEEEKILLSAEVGALVGATVTLTRATQAWRRFRGDRIVVRARDRDAAQH